MASSLSFIIKLQLFSVLYVIGRCDETTKLYLTISPSSGSSTENIEIRCQIDQTPLLSPLTSTKFENVYLRVKTDHVKPSGIFLKFDDTNDRCETNAAKPVHIDVCNATLILIRMNHTLLNDTLDKIDYSCSKGNVQVTNSYRILKGLSARFYDPLHNYSPSREKTSKFFLVAMAIFSIVFY